MNSSLLLWHTDNHTLHILYTYLLNHYTALGNVIYKFDHYLEMMLYKHVHRPEAAKSHALQPLPDNHPYGYYMSIVSFCGQVDQRCDASAVTDNDVVGGGSAVKGCPVACCYFQDYCPGKIVDYFEFLEHRNQLCITTDTDNTMHLHLSANIHSTAVALFAEPAVPLPVVICFPLKPKPHQLLDEDFVREHWLGEEAIAVSAETVD